MPESMDQGLDTANEGGLAAPGADQGTSDTEPSSDRATTGREAPLDDESFINPADLPDELKPHWKRMHGAYTRIREDYKQSRQARELVERFQADHQFAAQIIAQRAKELGYTLSPITPGAAGTAGPQATASAAPAEFVDAMRAQLGPELQWLAPALAGALWMGQQMTLAPLQQQRQSERQMSRQEEYSALAEEMDQQAPGWEQHEDEMLALYEFLQGDAMRHRRFGSKLQLLYNLVTGNAQAMRGALQRQADAAKARTTSGQPGRSSGLSLADRIRQAKTDQEAWELAAQEAKASLGRSGR